MLEKRSLRRSGPNFKTKTLTVGKLKGKENCENEHREKKFYARLCTENQCNQATLMAFYTNFAAEFFSHGFHENIGSVLKETIRRDQKVIFVKSPISGHSTSDALKKTPAASLSLSLTVKLQIFVRYPFSYF